MVVVKTVGLDVTVSVDMVVVTVVVNTVGLVVPVVRDVVGFRSSPFFPAAFCSEMSTTTTTRMMTSMVVEIVGTHHGVVAFSVVEKCPSRDVVVSFVFCVTCVVLYISNQRLSE